ncbi:sugar ABC transporter ATP-binding protein [Bradyrhizobium sp. HKCCYLR20261]|uniref:sugar ABC transporter ATP-binding protein n=1 Tax=Bradyrhizobium sp. HKCCYLR20261 TaxID=3420760 RepID=UPI003EB7BEE9
MTSATAHSLPDPSDAIRFEHVSVRFGGVRALDDVSFSVGRGEVHCLAGENGSGKSTLIKVIAGVYQTAPGARMEYFGERVEAPHPALARRKGVAVIWQDLALFPEMTVAENIAFDGLVGAPRLVRYRSIRETARAALAKLGVELDLSAPLRSLPISGRQLVAIARALACDSRLIFMDEPTASLTQAETDHLLAVVRTLSANGVAVVFVSHRLAEVLDISSRVTVLRDGRLVGVYDAQGMTQSRLTELMTGRTFDHAVTARDVGDAPVVVQTSGLTRAGEYADIDLTIRAGEIVGLIGLIGAGRTELAHTLFGMTRAETGTLRIAGQPISLRSNRDAIAAGVAYVSEDRLSLGLVQPQSIADNTVITTLQQLTGPSGLISETKKAAAVAKGIAEFAIKIGRPEDAVSTLSGGNQQRVVLAKWLATAPKLLILDCPTVGVDVGARDGIYRIARALAESGIAILMISDEVPEVYFNCDRILHMADGRIVAEIDPRKVSIAELERAVYA